MANVDHHVLALEEDIPGVERRDPELEGDSVIVRQEEMDQEPVPVLQIHNKKHFLLPFEFEGEVHRTDEDLARRVELPLQRREADVEGVHHIDYALVVGVGNAEAVEHRIEVDHEPEELKHMVLAVVHAIEEADAIDRKMAVHVLLEWEHTVVE
jgi:hypothetical protein